MSTQFELQDKLVMILGGLIQQAGGTLTLHEDDIMAALLGDKKLSFNQDKVNRTITLALIDPPEPGAITH